MGLLRNNSVTEEGFSVEDHAALGCGSVLASVPQPDYNQTSPGMLELGAHCKDSEIFRKCGICYEVPENGRVLDCFHTFCETCLERVWCDASNIRCTLCTRTTDIPEKGISFLPKNTFISKPLAEIHLTIPCDLCDKNQHAEVHCQDCDQKMCPSCRLIHFKSNASKTHVVQTLDASNMPLPDDLQGHHSKKNAPNTCGDHGEELSYHCRMCAKAICKLCRKEPVHKGHRTKPLAVVMDTKRKLIAQKMTSIENGHFEVLRKKLYNTRKQADALSNNTRDVISQIVIRTEDLKHDIDLASDALINEVLEKEKDGLERCNSIEKMIETQVLGIGSAIQY